MNLNLKLTDNLILHYIEANNFENENLKVVELSFSFFNHSALAYVDIDDLNEEFASYAMTEASTELSSSFNDLLEEDDVWIKIKDAVKLFEEDWKKEFVD